MTRMVVATVALLAIGCGGVPEEGVGEHEETLLSSLKGDQYCPWGSGDCNRCVWNPSAQLDRLQNNYATAGRIRFDGYAYPSSGYMLHRISKSSTFGDAYTYEHVQSIGRLAGQGNNEYMLFTHSTESGDPYKEGALAVVRMGANRSSGGYALGAMPYGDGANSSISNRTVARTYAGNNHPGGLAVLGRYAYVAQWCQPHPSNQTWCNEASASVHGMGFSVYDVGNVHNNGVINSNPPLDRHYRHVYGESWIGSGSTASVAAVKLSTGQYLVALGGAGGSAYGFYTSWSPNGPYTFQNSSGIPYWGENASMVTDCATGDLYLFQMEAYQNSYDRVHMFKMVLLSGGQITFQHIKSRQFTCRGGTVDGAANWCNFDAGVGFYTTPVGDLILYATDWHQNSGDIRLVEYR